MSTTVSTTSDVSGAYVLPMPAGTAPGTLTVSVRQQVVGRWSDPVSIAVQYTPLQASINDLAWGTATAEGLTGDALVARVVALIPKMMMLTVWYSAWDLSTLYQDAAGTIPVTAPGQRVGLWLDKSGNGRHASQSIAARRPTYNVIDDIPYVIGDGIDDNLLTPSFDLSHTDKITFAAVVRRSSGGSEAVSVEFGPSYMEPGEFFYSSSISFDRFNLGGPGSRLRGYASPVGSYTLVTRLDRADSSTPLMRVNGSVVGQATGGGPINGNYGVYPLSLFSRTPYSYHSSSSISQLLIMPRLLSDPEINQIEVGLRAPGGITL